MKGEDMKQGELHNTKISENVGVRSFRKSETSEFWSFPEMENIGNSGVSGNRITSKYTYLGNSPEFWVVLEPWERILTRCTKGSWTGVTEVAEVTVPRVMSSSRVGVDPFGYWWLGTLVS